MAEQDMKVSDLTTVTDVVASGLAMTVIPDPNDPTKYLSRKITNGDLAESYLNDFEFALLITKATNKSIIGAINEISFKELSATLSSGNTTLTISNAAITTGGTYDIFTDAFGVNPESVTVTEGEMELTFEERESDLGVKVRCY